MLKEDDVLLCKVKKIEGATVFLDIDGGENGTMVLSEVSAGRIRNLRNYVSVNKKVVCKVLKLGRGNIELSLRRVTAKEREGVLEMHKAERAFRSMLKSAGVDAENCILKIKEEYDIVDFLDEARKDKKILEKFVGVENVDKVFKVISEKSGKDKVVLKKFVLKSLSGDGVEDIKSVLKSDLYIRYLGNSVFSISASGKDFKEANAKLFSSLEEIEKNAKKRGMEFEVKGK